ncbi:HAD family hydrolase [Streptomyces pinistramenti]|uniref:HAD family hydrolase n=1 Tax=Streptomyces pinistramenti TaxID=2884812 RepID=UPI001D08BD97|nr:HAD-IA family hydrolase [Streptomyces pinistramenti]MCB5906575.1 HAD-IA family hydrolase [Streptomyces pinistramenti]
MHTAVLFDLDGTLIDTEPRSREAWARLFRCHGVPHDDAVLRAFAGRPAKEAVAEHLASFPGHTVEELCAEAMAYTALPDMPAVAPVSGARELLLRLRRHGVALGVVTSGPRGYAEGELAAMGALPLLDVLITADDVTRGKPDPEGYLAACSALRAAPGQAVVFEDAPAGILAAKRAGAFCVGLTTTQPANALAGADLVLPDLADVPWPIAAELVPDRAVNNA